MALITFGAFDFPPQAREGILKLFGGEGCHSPRNQSRKFQILNVKCTSSHFLLDEGLAVSFEIEFKSLSVTATRTRDKLSFDRTV